MELVTRSEFNSLMKTFINEIEMYHFDSKTVSNVTDFLNKLFIEIPQVFEFLSLNLDSEISEYDRYIYLEFTYENNLTNISYFFQFYVDGFEVEMDIMENLINDNLDTDFEETVFNIKTDKYDSYKSVIDKLKTIIK